MHRLHIGLGLAVALSMSACMHGATPASRTCSVLTDSSQLAGCVGKVVTVRGKVTHNSPSKIVGVEVDAPSALYDQVAHAVGTLESDGTRFTLKRDGGLAKAHSAR